MLLKGASKVHVRSARDNTAVLPMLRIPLFLDAIPSSLFECDDSDSDSIMMIQLYLLQYRRKSHDVETAARTVVRTSRH